MNEQGKFCPSCNSDIGIKMLFADGKLKCPRCRVKLKYNPLGVGFFSLLMFIYVGIVTLAIYLTTDILITRMSARAYMIFWMVAGLVLWIPFGYFAAFRLRMKSKLELSS